MSQTTALFICTANVVRSQIAAAFVQHYAGDAVQVTSAGTSIKDTSIHPLTIAVMEELDISMKGKKPQMIEQVVDNATFDYAITLCDEAEQAFPAKVHAANHLFWPFDDPSLTEGDRRVQWNAFRTVRDQIDTQVRQWLTGLGIAIQG
jgi:arsenate reductase